MFTSEVWSGNSYLHFSKLLLKWKCLGWLISLYLHGFLLLAPHLHLSVHWALAVLRGRLPTLWRVFLQSDRTCHIKQVDKCDHREAELQVPCLLTTCSSAEIYKPQQHRQKPLCNNKPLHMAKVQCTCIMIIICAWLIILYAYNAHAHCMCNVVSDTPSLRNSNLSCFRFMQLRL